MKQGKKEKKKMKKKLKDLLVEAARAAVAAIVGVFAAALSSGCTTVITPAEEAPCVSVTGAVPFGFQFNNAAKDAAER